VKALSSIKKKKKKKEKERYWKNSQIFEKLITNSKTSKRNEFYL
jgi:hypothetical protein